MHKLSHILLVDDDQTTNYLNQLLLQRLNVTEHLLVVTNGQHALELLQATAPTPAATLVLLDLRMPILDGYEFMEAYAQLPEPKQAVVVVTLTTSLASRDMERLQRCGAAGFVYKPLTAEKIAQVLETYFPLPGSSAPAQ